MRVDGSPASVVAAVREEADAEVERIRESTATELAAIAAEGAAANVAVPDRDVRLEAARRECEERLAKQLWEGRRAFMEQREDWIRRVVAAGQKQWPGKSAGAFDALVREARSHLPDSDCQVTIDPRGGCIVQTGELSFDNSFEARSRRLEPEWRNALGRMYRP